MTHHRAVRDIDPDGYLDFSSNFCGLLLELHTRKVLPEKRRRVRVLVSLVVGTTDNPDRVEVEKIYTFGYLCRLYNKQEDKPFDVSEHTIDVESRLEAYRKDGEKNMAWSGYVQSMHISKLIEQQKIVNSLPPEEREARRKKFEKQNGIPMIRIG